MTLKRIASERVGVVGSTGLQVEQAFNDNAKILEYNTYSKTYQPDSPVSTLVGKYIFPNGDIYNSEGYTVKIYPVDRVNKFVLKGKTRGLIALYAYYTDINLTSLVSVGQITESSILTDPVSIMIDPPLTANYIAITKHPFYDFSILQYALNEAYEIDAAEEEILSHKNILLGDTDTVVSPTSVLSGYYLATTGEILGPMAGFNINKYAVTAGQKYKVKGRTGGMVSAYAFYATSALTTVVSIGKTSSTDVAFDVDDKITVPVGATYIALTENLGQSGITLNTYVENTRDVVAELVANVNILQNGAPATTINMWQNEGWGAMGDSITAAGTYQPFVASALGLIETNCGVPSSRVSGSGADAFWQDARVSTIPIGAKLVTILGGTNDWGASAVLGLIDSVNTNEFYGAFNVLINKLLARNPLYRIMIMTTPQGNTTTTGWTGNTNLVALKSTDYSEACRLLAKRRGLPVIDIQANCGWSEANSGTFLIDGIHPNAIGHKRIAEEIIGELKKRNPIL